MLHIPKEGSKSPGECHSGAPPPRRDWETCPPKTTQQDNQRSQNEFVPHRPPRTCTPCRSGPGEGVAEVGGDQGDSSPSDSWRMPGTRLGVLLRPPPLIPLSIETSDGPAVGRTDRSSMGLLWTGREGGAPTWPAWSGHERTIRGPSGRPPRDPYGGRLSVVGVRWCSSRPQTRGVVWPDIAPPSPVSTATRSGQGSRLDTLR